MIWGLPLRLAGKNTGSGPFKGKRDYLRLFSLQLQGPMSFEISATPAVK
jgi:hypothetical protein